MKRATGGIVLAGALGIGLAAPVSSFAETAEVQAGDQRTMAEQYELRIAEPAHPFGVDDDYEILPFDGVPWDTKVELVKPNYLGTSHMDNHVLMYPQSHSLWVQIFPRYDYPSEIKSTLKLLVTYPDGSAETMEHVVSVNPADKYVYGASLTSQAAEPGAETLLPFSSLPAGTKAEVLDKPKQWDASADIDGLRVRTDGEGSGDVTVNFIYPDKSRRVETFQIEAAKSVDSDPPALETDKDDFAPDSGDGETKSGSSTGSIIAVLITALLVLGGAAAAVLMNPALRDVLPL